MTRPTPTGAGTTTLRTIPDPLRSPSDDEFWGFIGNGEIRIQHCVPCGTVRYPPEPVCPACLSPDATWKAIAGRGTLLAWTTFHRQYLAAFPVPYTVGAVVIEEGPIVCALLEGVADGDLRPDLPVRLVTEPVLREGGALSAIFSWRPDHERDQPDHEPDRE